jgi:hypothetical protein
LSENGLPIDQSPAEWITALHEYRIQHYEGRRLLLYRADTGQYHPMRLYCRGMSQYHARQGDKFDLIAEYAVQRNLPGAFLTLSPRTPPGTSPFEILERMEGLVNSLMSFVQYERSGHKLARPMYLWAIEPTQRGYCHLHIVFIGITWLISVQRLVEWWTRNGYGSSAGVEIKPIRPYTNEARNAIRYIAKYITKPISSPCWHGSLYLIGQREYGISNRLMRLARQWSQHKQAASPPAWACQGLSNSKLDYSPKPWVSLGFITTTEFYAFIHEKEPPPDQLVKDLWEIRGLARSVSRGTFRGGNSSDATHRFYQGNRTYTPDIDRSRIGAPDATCYDSTIYDRERLIERWHEETGSEYYNHARFTAWLRGRSDETGPNIGWA